MSIWTQAFLINMVLFLFYVIMNRLLEDKLAHWIKNSDSVLAFANALWIFFSMFTIPAWLIYLVVS